MNLPAGITVDQWATALRVIGHPWREGQKCTVDGYCPDAVDEFYGRIEDAASCGHKRHKLPMPAVTDELLMRMLRKIGQGNIARIWTVGYEQWTIQTTKQTFFGTLDAAIILAAASLEGK